MATVVGFCSAISVAALWQSSAAAPANLYAPTATVQTASLTTMSQPARLAPPARIPRASYMTSAPAAQSAQEHLPPALESQSQTTGWMSLTAVTGCVAAAVVALLKYVLRPAKNHTLLLQPVDHAPVALAATSGAKAYVNQCQWDPAGIIKNVVTFDRAVEAEILHGRYYILAAIAASQIGNTSTTASHSIPGWDYMQGLVYKAIFGLGGPEVAVIIITAGLVLGPKKMAELARDAGKLTGQMKDVTSEFQDAVQEGMKESQMAKESAKAEPVEAKEPEPKPQPPAEPPSSA